MRQLTKIMVLALLVSVVGCGSIDNDQRRLRETVGEFESRYETTVEFPVVSVSPDHPGLDGADGMCQMPTEDRPKRVLVSNDAVSDWGFVFHELGHCEFDLSHDNDTVRKDGDLIPETVMHPSPPTQLQQIEHGSYYKTELGDRIDDARTLPQN